MNIAPTIWHDIGPYRVLQHPLTTNPYWSSFWIYRNGNLLGKMLSVPQLCDCEHVERWGTNYADPEQTHRIRTVPLRGAAKLRKESSTGP